jgi:hypothetical protein
VNNLRKNLIMEGPFSVETPDTSGEVLMVEGADISSLQSGSALVNTDHINVADAEKSDVGDNFKGFQTIIGRVINAKKIFSEKDCDSDRQLESWNKFKKPMIYGSLEIYDDDDAHPNSRAAASLIKMFGKVTDGPKFGVSVEGATTKREGNILKATVIRDLAGTLKPANKAATVDLVEDTNAPNVNKSMTKITAGEFEPLHKSVAIEHMFYLSESLEVTVEEKLSNALKDLRKALTAGGGNAAPSTLTNGAALQSTSHLGQLAKMIGKKRITRDEIKKACPGISDEDADTVEKALKARNLKKSIDFAQNLYEKMTGKK